MPTYRFNIEGTALIQGIVEVNAISEDDARSYVENGTWDYQDIDITCIDYLNTIDFYDIVDNEECDD